MSRLISKLVLTILLFPLASLLYIIIFAIYRQIEIRSWRRYNEEEALVFAGFATWGFMAAYWFATWGTSVTWTASRLVGTAVAAALSAVAGLLLAGAMWWIDEDLAVFLGSAVTPLLWLCATALLWRESVTERAVRLGSNARNMLLCPTCSYNLTGLTSTRCPECGNMPTLEALVASQPAREIAELVD